MQISAGTGGSPLAPEVLMPHTMCDISLISEHYNMGWGGWGEKITFLSPSSPHILGLRRAETIMVMTRGEGRGGGTSILCHNV